MRPIDADEVLKHIDAYWGTCQRIRKPRNGETAVMLDIKAIIEAWPAVDAVPVVRCKDCTHWDGRYCHNKWWGDGHGNYTPPIKSEDGFCDWAEGKENGKID